MPKPPRGERNNNPGNIRRSGLAWQGMAAHQTDPAFVQFTSPVWGIRALAKVLLTYQRRYSLRTLRQIIGRWAPPVENDTGAYVAAVAKALRVQGTDRINVEDRPTLHALVKAIVKHECGRVVYTDDVIAAGVDLALK